MNRWRFETALRSSVRKEYIRALREADKGSIGSLMNFARGK